jgi:hypothetical protein
VAKHSTVILVEALDEYLFIAVNPLQELTVSLTDEENVVDLETLFNNHLVWLIRYQF